MNRIVILFSFLIFSATAYGQLLPSFGDSRTATTGFQFLKLAPDARSAGMGENYIAQVNDLSAVYWNPAGITQLDTHKLHIQVSHVEYAGGLLKHNFLAAGKQISPGTFLAAQLISINSGSMALTTEFAPMGTGQTFSVQDLVAGVTLGRVLTDNFSFGITAKFIHEGIASVQTNNVVADFAFRYDVGKANTRFAVGLYNFGSPATPRGEAHGIPFSYIKNQLQGDTVYSVFDRISVPAVFRIGIATDVIKKEEHLLSLCAQLNHPTDNNESFGLGAEYCWNNLLYARAGYQFGLDEKGLPGFGFGVLLKKRFGGIRLDYGFSNKKLLGTMHRITLSVDGF